MPDSDSAPDVMHQLRSAESLLDGIDLASLDAGDLPAVTTVLRRIEARCAAVAVSVAARARLTGNDVGATLLGQGRVSGRRVRTEAKRADVVEQMPEFGDALQAGQISGEHLDAVARARTGLGADEVGRFDELAPELAEAATRLPVDTFNRRLRTLIDEARADHGMTRLEQQRARSSVRMWEDADGMGHLHVTADPERFAKVRTAIETETASMAAATKKGGDATTLGPALQLDALVELLSGGQRSAGRPAVTVVVDQATLTAGPHDHTLCETETGAHIPPPVIERYLCDAVVRHITLDDAGVPINVGRRYRTATAAQWAALNAIYSTCSWKGCDRPITWTQAHHIHEWEHGGRTDLDNLIPLCSRHHHMVHDAGWRLVLHSDRTLEIHLPPPVMRHSSGPPAPVGPDTLWATTTPDRIPPPTRPPPTEQARTGPLSVSGALGQ